MVAVTAPAPGDMEGLEALLDKIVGAQVAKLFGGVSLLERVEVGRLVGWWCWVGWGGRGEAVAVRITQSTQEGESR